MLKFNTWLYQHLPLSCIFQRTNIFPLNHEKTDKDPAHLMSTERTSKHTAYNDSNSFFKDYFEYINIHIPSKNKVVILKVTKFTIKSISNWKSAAYKVLIYLYSHLSIQESSWTREQRHRVKWHYFWNAFTISWHTKIYPCLFFDLIKNFRGPLVIPTHCHWNITSFVRHFTIIVICRQHL